jgi:hypothetical protein
MRTPVPLIKLSREAYHVHQDVDRVLAWGFMVFTTLIVIGMLRLWWVEGREVLDVKECCHF